MRNLLAGLGARLQQGNPARVVVVGFLVLIFVGTLLLMTPVATASGQSAGLRTSLFTATSSVCVTGLVLENTGTYWSGFGQAVILAMIQVGGFGLMAGSSLAALLVARRIGLRQRMAARAETGTLDLGDVRRVIRGVAAWSFGIEGAVAVLLAGNFALTHGHNPLRAVWEGAFHAVSSFNNAGFALYGDSLEGFVGDPFISLVVSLTVIIGGVGFPVLMELRRELTPRTWSIHTKLTVLTSAVLLAVGTAAVLGFEWTNEGTLGPLGFGDKMMAGWFQGVTPRTAGFSTVPYAQMNDSSLFVTTILMFIGGGSASTAGGIKVTTFSLLAYVIWSEIRGDADVNVFRRRVTEVAQRQALTIALLGVAAVVVGGLVTVTLDGLPLVDSLFEATSAFGTVGLTTGITDQLGLGAELGIVVLMFVGRLGPVTLASALAARGLSRSFRYAQERPLIG